MTKREYKYIYGKKKPKLVFRRPRRVSKVMKPVLPYPIPAGAIVYTPVNSESYDGKKHNFVHEDEAAKWGKPTNTVVIPKSIVEQEKMIRHLMNDPRYIGVTIVNKRRYGRTLLQQLLQTQDVPHETIDPNQFLKLKND